MGTMTDTLPMRLQIGRACTVEGPCGRFAFESGTPRQIWVEGGIGITSFIARKQALAAKASDKPIDLFGSLGEGWTTRRSPACKRMHCKPM
jgi:predicted ferric reductase